MINGECHCSPVFKEENIMQKRNRIAASVVCLILVAAMIVTSFVGLGVM